ncbi:MAG: group II intron reverse transcriptase/maturase [Syntrophothermus sp.]|uniref:group II intron reverse transcriptase/maturase n=1 Tax=Syntrophothermus sp. TaxID=2736299 RepID=UPI00257BDEB8|nr:group II intron reverse transcriptase/maturase [Syntrophothermus sp.]NSW84643.1 group II intron reverse transcriptase/maturase [Syntrophothermus sp.]
MGEIGAAKRTKVHSLIDKVYSRTNLRMAWEKVKANQGAGGIDKVSIAAFDEVAEEELERLYKELKENTYKSLPVRRVYIPKRGKPGEERPLGIPAIRDRICQQALKNRLEPIFEPEFNDCSFGYRPGRSPHDAMRKIWLEIMAGYHWILDADLKDYFGSVPHEKLIDMVAEKVSDGRVLELIRQMLKAGYVEKGKRLPTPKGTPQGGVISPLLSNIYLTPFDNEMTNRGYRLTRFADDWTVLCRTKAEAYSALKDAKRILEGLGLKLHPEKTRITHVKWGFEFLGYKIKQGKGLKLPEDKIKSQPNKLDIYAVPAAKSIKRFMDQIRAKTKRRIPLTLKEIIDEINPIIRGWGNYYRKAHIRKLFNRLDRWIIRRLWSHQLKRWRNTGWRRYPTKHLYGYYKLVNLVHLIPSLC